jgi:hypothetical protein
VFCSNDVSLLATDRPMHLLLACFTHTCNSGTFDLIARLPAVLQ